MILIYQTCLDPNKVEVTSTKNTQKQLKPENKNIIKGLSTSEKDREQILSEFKFGKDDPFSENLKLN